MKPYIDVGCSPTEESCAQVGSPHYYERAQRECRAYIGQLRRRFGAEPDGAVLTIILNPHDFGTYLSVVCYYNPTQKTSIDYAFRCENQSPTDWDELAQRELTEGGVS